METSVFEKGAGALARILAFSPSREASCLLFCQNVVAVQALRNATYKRNYDPPISRICPHPECFELHSSLKQMVLPYQVINTDLELEECLVRIQKYSEKTDRNDSGLVEGILCVLAKAQLQICEDISKCFAKETIKDKVLDDLLYRVRLVYEIFRSAVVCDGRLMELPEYPFRILRSWHPSSSSNNVKHNKDVKTK